MTKKSDTPAIRFKGFTDTWEQRKLGDIASDMVAGGDIDKDLILAEGQYPVIANALTGDGIVGYYDKEYRVNAPAVTVTGRGDVGHAKARLVNFTPVVRLLSVKSEHDVFFLENAINTLKIVIESTGVPQLTVPQLAKYEVAFPRQLDEEEHIGAFFKQLDHLITLHQRKYDKLTNVKKSMLEKMFPKNGSNVPEIRFKGFTEAWEQRKVSDVAEICTGGTPSTGIEKYWYPKEIPWLSSGEVHKKYITYTDNKISVEGMNNSSARMIPENSVLIALAGQGKTRGTVAINRIPLTTNQSIAAMAFSNEVVPEFVFCNLESRYEEIRRMSSGDGSRGGLNKQIIGETEIPYTSKEEQTKIGAYFFNLDNLITLHQRELEKLKNIKKSCLENMFV